MPSKERRVIIVDNVQNDQRVVGKWKSPEQ